MSLSFRNLMLASLPLAIGCSSSEPTISTPPAPLQEVAEKADALSETAKDAAEPETPVEETQEEPTKQSAYTAPYPERRTLFSPPKQLARAPRQVSGELADSVVLMGFAKIDEPSVLLAINGRVTPLGHGEEASGVRVISIDPPRAVLQRGRSRWTASIE